ncbi:MAG: hypothetical protein JSW61_10100 [Candidatus Thorarchaeota archaeon]|nr:MAG: hypothetical protein JSW61_10100 [Candidatus Thorarchaeota archaeon]
MGTLGENQKIRLVRRPSLLAPRYLLRYLFFTEKQIEQASRILNEIIQSDGAIPDWEWERLMLSSRGLYVKVRRKLIDVGLVEKRNNEFRLSKDFSKSLEKMAGYWTNIVEEFSMGDRSMLF